MVVTVAILVVGASLSRLLELPYQILLDCLRLPATSLFFPQGLVYPVDGIFTHGVASLYCTY